MLNDANKKQYLRPLEEDEINAACEDMSKGLKQVTLWIAGQEKLSEEITVDSIDVGQRVIFLNRSSGKENRGQPYLKRKVLIKATVKKTIYFFDTTLEYAEDDNLLFIKFSDKIFITVQRSDCRLEAGKIHCLELKVGTKSYRGFDISAGGMSFLIDKDDLPKFPQNTVIEQATITLNSKNFVIPKIEVMAIIDHKKDSSGELVEHKLGCRFVSLPHAVESDLYRHINDCMRSISIEDLKDSA